MTQELRQQMQRHLNKQVEHYKVRVRGLRRDAMGPVAALLTKDEGRRIEKEVQRIHDAFIKQLDDFSEAKRKEIAQV